MEGIGSLEELSGSPTEGRLREGPESVTGEFGEKGSMLGGTSDRGIRGNRSEKRISW